MKVLPQVRTADLVVQELKGETLVYDLRTNKALCLNKTSAIVWRYCDGKTLLQELVEKHDISNELILIALNDFQKNELLSSEIMDLLPKEQIERRQFMVKAASTAAVMFPLMTMVIAPRAVAAQSCLMGGTAIDLSPQPDGPTCFAAVAAFATANCCSGTTGTVNFTSPDQCISVCFNV